MSKTLSRKSSFASMLIGLAVAQMVVAPAYAAGPTKVLVLQAQGDDLAAADRAAITTVVRDALKPYKSIKLLATPEVDLLDVMMDLECLDIDDACIAAIGKKYGGQQVLFTSAAPQGGGFALDMKRIDVAKSAAVANAAAKAGSRANLTKVVSGLIEKTVGPKPVKKPAKPKKPSRVEVEITTVKPGATVYLGKVKLKGVTPLKVSLKPGRYTIRLEQKGFKTVVDKLKVVSEGKNSAVYDLVANAKPVAEKPVDSIETAESPAPAPAAEDDTPVYKQWWFWTVIGVAVVGGVTAGLVVGLQDDEPAATGVLNFGISSPDADPRVRAAR